MTLFKQQRNSHSSGQALAEFAIIIIFLSMLMFFIVDMARVGWAWVTVQGAARAGARYASTGNASCQDPPSRLDCVIDAAYNYMSTLKLHEDPQAPWGSDNAYRIEVWGIDESNDGPWYDYPGAAGKSMVVRAYYWVPIITPFFKPIKDNIPVYGQVTITNELFDSLGGASAGVGLPPPAPPIPPPQPTATPSPPDLLVSEPIVSIPPSAEYEPFEVQVVITNTGEVDAGQQFFVDVFLDPSEINANSIPLYQSGGYLAVSDLPGGSSRTLTINMPVGFTDGMDENREVWAMVDSFEQIYESDEENNIGGPTLVTGVLTSTVGPPAPEPAGAGEISGIVRIYFEDTETVQPQARAQLWLVDVSGVVISTAISDINGHYQFLNIEIETYRVWACVPIDESIYARDLPGIIPTTTEADLILLEDILGCPYPQ